jgi:NADPH-dependent curcumin reductase
MAATIGKRIVLAARPHGPVTVHDFRIEDFALRVPETGELLLEVKYFSLDPYMRGRMDDKSSYAVPVKIGEVMPSDSISTVLVSQHPAFSKGDLALVRAGWQTHATVSADCARKIEPQHLPVTTRLGVLGMPGFTAYAGMTSIAKPTIGETVVVAAASGPVGSLVGQLARLAGARAVGIAGGSAKCAYLREELGFDAAVDHRSADFAATLSAACPDGIDVYFENVGGRVWDVVLPLLNRFARVPVCGLVAEYEAVNGVPATMRHILNQRLLIQGFIFSDFVDRYYDDFLRDVGRGIDAGLIKYREDIVDGLENAPRAFIGMLAGNNFGKLIVRLSA